LAPDRESVVTIVPMCGRALIVGNRFEDANWVNAGYGCALDVIYSGNALVRCAELLNYGLASPQALLPNFNAQFLDNELGEGQGSIHVNGSVRPAGAFAGAITQNVIHRRARLAVDNSGGIAVQGALREVVIEGCTVANRASGIRVDRGPAGVLVRRCRSTAGELRCEGATQEP
jgi:hypothetical protein